MARAKREELISPPLMFAFRHAHARRGAKAHLDPQEKPGPRADDARDAASKPRESDAGRRVVTQRNATRLAVTVGILKQEVRTDLEQLMNTISLASSVDLDAFEHVRKSILNFGCPDIVHRTIDEVGVGDISKEIADALYRYEPRLAPGSVRVQRDETADPVALKVRFVVVAQLRWNPVNVPVEFFADVEFDSGKIAINRI